MRQSDAVPYVRIGLRTVRPFGFNQFRNAILRSTENAAEAQVEVVAYPEECEIAVIEQGCVYESCPDAYAIRLTHQEARDAYQVSMRVRRELKAYLARDLDE